jgi:Uma2 family endonuclease
MSLLIRDRSLSRKMIARRKAHGLDRYDEVWNGVYVMPPMPNNEHHALVTRVVSILADVLPIDEGIAYAGVNVSDRVKGWKKNYRVPDVCIYLVTNPAQDCGTHWCGGPDWLTEIASPDEDPHEKFEFYESVRVRELLIINRDPWSIDLYQLQAGKLVLVGKSDLYQPNELKSAAFPLSFRIAAGITRPLVLVRHTDGTRQWHV